MLFWEAVSSKRRRKKALAEEVGVGTGIRLPFDRRCRGLTKSGKRCRARIREGRDYCIFHDPDIPHENRRRAAAKGGKSRKRMAHLPDGYLRPLTDRTAVGKAMDRLYREVRLGIVTPDMGRVLFDILCRMLDTEFAQDGGVFGGEAKKRRRGRTYRTRGKLEELLTEDEMDAWNRAVDNAPASFKSMSDEERVAAAMKGSANPAGKAETLSAAS